MTVLTREQAEKVCPEAFGKGPRPPKCDICAVPWSDEAHPVRSPYGPFVIHACQSCSVKLAKRQAQRRPAA